MKLYFLKQECLDTLKKNISHNINHYSEKDNKWIYEYLDDEKPFLEFKHEVNDFKLKIDGFDSVGTMDLENSKILYSNLKVISDSAAVDERLWAGLTHSLFYNFVQERWKKDAENMKHANYIKSRYFYSEKSKGVFRNTLSKLWWIGRLTYDENRKDPYELTNVLANGDMATRVNDMFTSNFSRNPKNGHAFLSAIKEFEDNGTKINGYVYRKTVQYMNAYGGITLIDYLSEDEIKDVVYKKIERLLKESGNVKRGKKVIV
ncbi:MAG: DUF6339 family protein [Clostridiaceae bacterium]|nr:DUF6339 family protein [Clostridiaceae bacterium]